MKIYKASEELAQILLKNGFKEITSTKFPDHHKQIIENGYNPYESKRAFEINSKNYVLFEYDMIKALHKEGCAGSDMKTEFSENEVKSIIAFFKLPYQTRNAFKRKGLGILTLHEKYFYITKNPEYKKRNDQIIVDAFESIILN
jgi:hypothetical protein